MNESRAPGPSSGRSSTRRGVAGAGVADEPKCDEAQLVVRDIQTETMVPTHTYYGDDFCVIEHEWTGTVPGSFLGVPGNGQRVSFRIAHRLRVPRAVASAGSRGDVLAARLPVSGN